MAGKLAGWSARISDKLSFLTRIPLLTGGFSFGSGKKSLIGLSVGSSAIKIVELKKSGKTWKLEHFGVVQLPENTINDQEMTNPVAVTDCIKALVSQIKFKEKRLCTSLAGSSLIIKRLNLDVPNMRELPEQVVWEAEQYLPYEVSQVALDYQVLSRSKEGKVDLLLVAVKDSVLESYRAAIADAGLLPKIFDVDFFALLNLFEISYQQDPATASAIVDLGATSMKFVVIHNSIPIFTKETIIGGKNLTAEIQRQLNLSYADAETLKIGGQGEGHPQEVIDLMNIMNENLAGEIKKSIDFYNASSSAAPVGNIYLSGGSSKIPNISKVVTETTSIPTQLFNPFAGITYDSGVFSQEYLDEIAPLVAIPIGLAMRMSAG